MALLLGNVAKYEFLTGGYAFTEKELLEKAAAVKILEFPPLLSELKKQTYIAEKRCQLLNENDRFDKKEVDDENISRDKNEDDDNKSTDKKKDGDNKSTGKIYNKSNLIYDSRHYFYRCNNIEKFASLHFKLKYSHLQVF